MRARGQKLTLPLSIPDRSNRNCGYITIIVEYVSESKLRLNYEMSISQISKHSYIGKGRGPYLTVSRCSSESSQSDSWITVMRTAAPGVPNASGGFDLPRLTYNYEKFCRCDDNRQLRFDLSYEKGGKYRVVASALSSLRDCDRRDGFIELKPVERGCFPSTRRVPRLRLYNRRVTEDTTFLDYVIGGCEISLVIGIDFTASNGNPLQRGSLHFADSMGANEYEMAIRAVGDILAAYDSDQLFPTYGFGAKLPPDFDVPSHKFPLSGSEDANCHTIEDVLNMYRHTLYNVRLSGPTEFSQIIRAAAEHAAEEVAQNEQSYTILLIVTDGVINDLKCTLKEIERATSLPLSIVIIGVGGDADFTDMNLLDGDDLGHERDIVQFVNFRQYADTPEVLRAMVLEEIPQQLVQYMKQRGLEPYPPPVD